MKTRIRTLGLLLTLVVSDPTSFEPFQSPERAAFNGHCLVIVRAKPGAAGAITVTASSAGLSRAVTTITAGP